MNEYLLCPVVSDCPIFKSAEKNAKEDIAAFQSSLSYDTIAREENSKKYECVTIGIAGKAEPGKRISRSDSEEVEYPLIIILNKTNNIF